MATNEIRVLSLRDYVSIFRSRAVWIVAAIAVALAIAFAFSALRTPLYRAEARVRVEPAASSLVGDNSNVASNVRDRNLQNEVDFAESDRVAAKAQEDYGAIITADVSPAGSSDKLIFTAVDDSAVRAAEIANIWAESFVSERRAASGERYLNSLAVIDTRLDEIAADRGELEQQRASAADTAPIDSQLAALDSAESGLREQLNDIDVLIELNQSGTVSILNAATRPDGPFSPNWPLNIALGLIAGTLFGAGLALALEALDDTIRIADQLRAAMDDSSVLAAIPPPRSGRGAKGDSPGFTEAFRSLQLGIEFSKTKGTTLHSVLITSPNASEGKSTVAANLAMAYARSGSIVLLIDADMHNPTQADFFDISPGPGLAEQLEGRETAILFKEHRSATPRLAVLQAGRATAPPSQLLSSVEALEFIRHISSEFDIVIIDSPPLLPVADTRTLARLADATILVAMANETTSSQVEDAMRQLEQVGVCPLGGVLNGVEHGTGDYYGSK
ncbi:MAG: succinoglycan biosynthesis transport protein ExoP [Verrucomicrobiales bacterium]|jgi:succinoglycan biosynthesis transport protein ExoP